MGAPIRTSSDVPDFSTYPSAPSDHLLSAHASRSPLHEVAAEVGSRLGEGANVVRAARDRAWDRIHSMRDSLDELYGSARSRSMEVAQQGLDHLRAESQVQVRRAKEFADARPLAVIAAAGVAGVLLGAGIRAWRGNRG